MKTTVKKNKKDRVEWEKLENASKIFPATSSNKDTKVYRISAELYEDVNPKNLQEALDLTLESFPMYKSILRRGFFWYYFEKSNIKPLVEIEDENPCSPIYIEGKKNLLFKVSYYMKRINFEIFHALSDGTGAVWFLETLVYHYMKINYGDEFGEKLDELDYGASISQKEVDSFWKNYTPEINKNRIKKEKHPFAYRIRGKRLEENKMKVLEGSLSVNELIKLSREYNKSITVFLTSLLFYSIFIDMPINKKKKPIVISIPVDLRSYYNSQTARNFFTTMNISYDFKNKSSNFKDILEYVDQEFKNSLTQDKINLKLARYMKFEYNPIARIIPLAIKDLFMKIADKINDKKVSSSISNIGKIQTPKDFETYIKQFSICVSARSPKITFCSYKDKLLITFTSPYIETDIQREFFQFLSNKGIRVEITSNM